MPDDYFARRPGLVERAARVAFAFLMMNASVVGGLVAYAFRRKVWR